MVNARDRFVRDAVLQHGYLACQVASFLNCRPSNVNDAFFRFVVDMGGHGLDQGKGGKYLIVPPGYKGELPKHKKDGGEYFVAHSTSYVNWIPLRGFLVHGKPDLATKMFKEAFKVYPLSKAGNPPKMEFISGSKIPVNTIHANDFEFYQEVDHVIQKEPVDFLDPELRGLAASIGIRKGQKFAPDERMKKILMDAVAVGNATARAISFRTRDPGAPLYENSNWQTFFIGGEYRWLNDGGAGGRNLDARTRFFYVAMLNNPAMAAKIPGRTSQYAGAFVDTDVTTSPVPRAITSTFPPTSLRRISGRWWSTTRRRAPNSRQASRSPARTTSATSSSSMPTAPSISTSAPEEALRK